MRRREFLAGLAGSALAAHAAAVKTNFVLILADDFGWRDLACYGNPYFATPNLDRLAASGARFTNAYAACPVCSPTRASILTGKYPVRTGVTDWIPGRAPAPEGPLITPATAMQLALEEVTIAERLGAAGYRSASIGKWHLGGKGFGPLEQGFRENVGGNQSGSPPATGRPYFGPFELPGIKAGPEDFLTGKLTDAAVDFVARNRANPFLLYLPHYTVHIPLGARERDIARHREKAQGRYNPIYGAMVESLDESVGRVLGAIDQAGVADHTMVMFFSDNGGLRFEGASKAAVTDNAPLRAGKGHLYEGGIREPLMVRFPGVVKAGRVIDTPVSSVDLLPTMCDSAGVAAGDVDGVSLMPLLRGGSLAARPLFWHYPHYSNQGGEPGSAIREGDWKLIEFHRDGRRELFDLRADVSETRNLVEKDAGRARAMAAKLDAWRKRSGAVMPARNPAANQGVEGLGADRRGTPDPGGEVGRSG